MKKWLFLLFLPFFCQEAAAQSAENIRAIETYLNNLKSLEATFVQMSSNGGTAEGNPIKFGWNMLNQPMF